MNVVLYTDGSFRSINNVTPTNGYSGCGIHGYGYLSDTINKPNGDKPKNYLITTQGYKVSTAVKKDEVETVIPCLYLDCIISYKEGNSNSSIVELKAMIEAISYLIKNTERLELKNVTIYTDSSYVELMCNKILNNIAWKNKDTSNVELVEQLEEKINDVRKNGVSIEILKIKAHDGELGNELVDRLANIGSHRSKKNMESLEWSETLIDKGIKYWSVDNNQHPLLEFKQLFFSGLPEYVDNLNNKILTILDYNTGILLGKKTNTATFGIVKLKKVPSEIEDVMKIYDKHRDSIANNSVISTCNLHNLYNRDNLYFHNLAKDDAYRFSTANNHLYNVLSKPIVYTIKPAVLVVQTLEYMQELNLILDYFENKDYNKEVYSFIDVTDNFYKLDKNLTYKAIPPADNALTTYYISVKINNIERSVPIELGEDVPSLVQFKHLEKKTPKVFLVLKKISPQVVNYYTIIKVDDGIGIFCNLYSGKLLLDDKK